MTLDGEGDLVERGSFDEGDGEPLGGQKGLLDDPCVVDVRLWREGGGCVNVCLCLRGCVHVVAWLCAYVCEYVCLCLRGCVKWFRFDVLVEQGGGLL